MRVFVASFLRADLISTLFFFFPVFGWCWRFYGGPAVLMEFLVAVFSLSVGAGACFWNKRSVAVF